MSTALSVALCAGLLCTAPAGADTVTDDVSLSLHGDAGDFITHGSSVYLRSASDKTIIESLTTSNISLIMTDHATGLDYTLQITPAAQSGVFRAGEFGSLANTQAHGSREGGDYLMMGGAGRGCSDTGSVRIADIAASGSDITRLDLAFVGHCDGDTYAHFGDLQVNEPPGLTAQTSDRTLQWPDTDPRVAAAQVPVTLVNASTRTAGVSFPSLEGADAQSFQIVSSTCPSQLQVGASCTTLVSVVPGGRGVSTATFVQGLSGQRILTALIGPATDGVTELDLDGRPGEPLSGGTAATLVPENARVAVQANQGGINFLTTDGSGNWQLRLAPTTSTTITAGTHATRRAASQAGYGLDVSGRGIDCDTSSGTITIRQLSFDPLDGSVARLDASFVTYCDDDTIPLTGRVRINATTVETDAVSVDAAPRMISYGATVPISGHAEPNAAVTVLTQRRGTTGFTVLANTYADTTGTWRVSDKLSDDSTVVARQPADRGSASQVQSSAVAYRISPTLTQHGTIAVKRGTTITLSGTANPHLPLTITTRTTDRVPRVHTRAVHVASNGRWAANVVVSQSFHVSVTTTSTRLTSSVVGLRATT